MNPDRSIALFLVAALLIGPGRAAASVAGPARSAPTTIAAPVVLGGDCGDPGCTFLHIPDDGYDGSFGSMACAGRHVSGSSQDVITRVGVSFGISHTYVGDLTIKLFTPHSGVLGLLSRPGMLESADDGSDGSAGDSSDLDSAFPLRFDDDQPTSAEDLGAGIEGSQAACRDDGACGYHPAPGSIAVPPASFADLRGQPFTGTWTLCVGDSYPGDIGTLLTTWDLDLETAESLATFTVTPSVGAPGGLVDPPDAQTVYDGNRAVFTLLPDAGFHVDSVGGGCGGDLDGDVFTTDPVVADCTVVANFASDTPRHEVTPSIGTPGGTIDPDTTQSVVEGSTTSFTLTPDAGFHVDTVGGTCDGNLAGNVFTTAPVRADCTVIANFAADGTGCQVGDRWCGTPQIAIPDNGYDGTLASMACSAIHADAIPAGDVITGVAVSLGVTHYRLGELTTKLLSPSGTVLGLFSRPGNDEGADDGSAGLGGDYSDLDAAYPLRFADAAPHDAEAMGAELADDRAVCRDDGACDFAPNPGSVATPPARFADLRGEPAAGTWTLCVGNSERADSGDPHTGTFEHWTITILHAGAAGVATVTPRVGTGDGAISPATAQLVPIGDTASFTLAADPGFHVDTIGGTCGGTLAGDVFTVDPVVADCEVVVNFAADGAGCTSGDRFCSTQRLAIPDDAYDGSLGSMACSSIDAGAIPVDDVVTRVSIRTALDHSAVGDLGAKLISPDGGILGVFSRPGLAEGNDDGIGTGGASANLDATFPLAFDDAADHDAESIGATLGSDATVCADDGACTFFPNPDSIASQPDAFTGFLDHSASGTWTLCVGDGGDAGNGELAGWDITIEHAAPGPAYRVEPRVGTPGGAIRPGADVLVPLGVTATFRLEPDPGFHLDTLGGTCAGVLEGHRFTTDPISEGCEVIANFAPNGGGCNVGDTFCSTRVLPIIDNAYDGSLASMTCSAIDAGAIPAGDEVTDITLEAGISHTRVGDLVAKLVSPDGSVLGLFSRPGFAEPADDGVDGSGYNTRLDADYPLAFDDAASNDAESMGASLESYEVICEDDARCTYFPNPDSIATPPAGFADLRGESASGTWTLCVGDAMWAHGGTLENWRIHIDHASDTPTHVVTPQVGTPSGALAPADPQEVFEGTTVQFRVNPAPGFHIERVGGTCGGSLDGNRYTTAPVTADCTVLADFAVDAAGSFPPDEDFDAVAAPALPDGWTTGASGAGVAWQTTTDVTQSAPNAAFAPELPADADMWLDSPPFVAGAGETLSFHHYYNLERFFDGAVLEISIAGGPFTDILAAGGQFLANGYDTEMLGSSSPFHGGLAWSGQSQGLVETVVELPAAAAGESCRLRFRTADDATSVATGNTGWWVDSIHLSGSGATTWTLTPSVGTPAGSIDPSTPVAIAADDTFGFLLTPDAGYHIESVGGTCGGTLAGSVFTTAPATADCSVIANFRADTHTVDASVGTPSGTISPSGSLTVDDEDTISFTLAPDTGFHIDTVDSSCGGTLAGDVFTTAPVTTDCSVVANFAIDTHVVTPGIGAPGGTIAPDTPQSVEHGATTGFVLTPDANHHIDRVDGTCGGTLAGDVFTTAPVTADCSVVASFARDPDATITPDRFAFTVAADETAIDVLALANAAGADPLTYAIRAREPSAGSCSGAPAAWLVADPDSGSVAGGDDVLALLTADPDAAQLAEGEYQAELCVATNDPDQALVAIPVDLTVTPANGVFCSGFEDAESGLCTD